MVYVPEKCFVNGECDSEGKNSTGSVVELLRQVPPHEIYSRQRLEVRPQTVVFGAQPNKRGYNDLDDPDSFLSILAETWHLV